MPEKIKVVLITLLCFVVGFLGSQVYRDSIRIRGLERQVAAERAHSATCHWGCPAESNRIITENHRQIEALTAQVAAMRHNPGEECTAEVAEAVRQHVRVGSMLDTMGERDDGIERRFAAVERALGTSCAFWWARRHNHPNDPRYGDWVQMCRDAGIESVW